MKDEELTRRRGDTETRRLFAKGSLFRRVAPSLFLRVHAFILLPSSFQTGCGGRMRTFDSRINNAVPYQLGYATKNRRGEGEARRHGEKARIFLRVSRAPRARVRYMEAMKGVEPLSTGLQDRRSVIQLSYIAIN
jgi:hypothetical protein